MNIVQQHWTPNLGWSNAALGSSLGNADWVMVFGSRDALEQNEAFPYIRQAYPGAVISICSTAGEILGDRVFDDTISVTAVKFDHTTLQTSEVDLASYADHQAAGYVLGQKLSKEQLQFVFVLSDGHNVNVGNLVSGLNQSLGGHVPIAGGLAGDGYDFAKTIVGLNARPSNNKVLAMGFYGSRLRIGLGSVGGWDSFGPLRTVTKSQDNVLLELDGQSALDLYKKYLGDRADELPGAALLFPLSIDVPGHPQALVRTILGVDEEHKTMTFAGNIPEGAKCRIMKANFDRIISGATEAAESSALGLGELPTKLAILVSCVGRKLILGNRVDEEIEEVRNVLGPEAAVTGFYSYGEFSPLAGRNGCELHNQTMTITTMAEA